jgi:N-acyl-D-aspartate/D-glutamate deacylase
MKKKGRLQVGADADITIFDAGKIIDKATYTQPAQYSAGVEYVMVNGTLVLDKGEIVQGVFPGQAIKANSLAIEVRARSPFRLSAQAG